jgi:hypothetical protein
MVSVTHAKVVTTPDDGTSEVGSDEWNDEHVVTGVREMLAADRDYYVNATLGSDSNTGLTSGAGAFATIQKAVDVVCDTLDLQKYDVVINVAAGTYAEEISLRRYVGGTGEPDRMFTLQEPPGTEFQYPYNNANVTIQGEDGVILTGFPDAAQEPTYNARIMRVHGCSTPWFINDLEFDAADGQDGIEVGAASNLLIGRIKFHGGTFYCIYIIGSESAVVFMEGATVSFSGGAYASFVNIQGRSTCYMPEHCTIDMEDDCSFSDAFLAVGRGGLVDFHRMDAINHNGHIFTGYKWYTWKEGVINVHYNSGGDQALNSVLPGGTDGQAATGGMSGLLYPKGIRIGAAESPSSTIVPTGQLLIAGSTVTDTQPVITAVQTWNDAADTFTAIKANITNTNSAAGSKLIDLQVGSTSRFYVTREGIGHLSNCMGLGPLTVTALPSTPVGGQICYVTDATTNTVATTVVGGSTYNTLVWYNGTNWSIFAS